MILKICICDLFGTCNFEFGISWEISIAGSEIIETIMKNLKTIKKEFPIFGHHEDLVYLDSTATTLKPQSVIDAVSSYYGRYSANVGRGLYPIAEEATVKFEEARAKVAAFIGASPEEIVFVRNTTEGFNLLAGTLEAFLERDDNIVVTEMEHHSNFLPWRRIADRHDVEFRMLPINADGILDPAKIGKFVDGNTAIVSFPAVSNVLGTIVPVADVVKKIKRKSPDAAVLIDASQVAGHSKIDVTAWGAGFIVFSGHKMFGPTGAGVVWGKKELLDTLPPFLLGGGMVLDACPDQITTGRACPTQSSTGRACADAPVWKDAPHKFEAGTPDIASVIGLGAAVDFIRSVGMPAIERHERKLVRYAMKKLAKAFGKDITIFGTDDLDRHAGLISFTLEGIHPHDLAQVLGERNICIRAGEHCASPIHRKLGLSATARASFSIYNDTEDIDKLINTMKAAVNIFESTKPETQKSKQSTNSTRFENTK